VPLLLAKSTVLVADATFVRAKQETRRAIVARLADFIEAPIRKFEETGRNNCSGAALQLLLRLGSSCVASYTVETVQTNAVFLSAYSADSQPRQIGWGNFGKPWLQASRLTRFDTVLNL